MKCEQVKSLLFEYYAQELANAQAAEVGAHLQQCGECRAEAEEVQRMRAWLAAVPEVAPPPRVREGILVAVAPERVPVLTCETVLPLLSEHLDGVLTRAQKRLVRRHLAVCTDCRRAFAALKQTVQLTRRVPLVAPPADLRARIYAHLGLEQPTTLWARLRVSWPQPTPAWAPALAAAVVVVLALGWGWFYRPSVVPPPESMAVAPRLIAEAPPAEPTPVATPPAAEVQPTRVEEEPVVTTPVTPAVPAGPRETGTPQKVEAPAPPKPVRLASATPPPSPGPSEKAPAAPEEVPAMALASEPSEEPVLLADAGPIMRPRETEGETEETFTPSLAEGLERLFSGMVVASIAEPTEPPSPTHAVQESVGTVEPVGGEVVPPPESIHPAERVKVAPVEVEPMGIGERLTEALEALTRDVKEGPPVKEEELPGVPLVELKF